MVFRGQVLGSAGVQEAGRSQPDLWRVLGQMRIIAAVMTAPPMSHSRPACARGAMGAITAIPITMTRSPSIVSSKFRGISIRGTPGRGDSVSRCDRQHSSALSARQRRSDDVPAPRTGPPTSPRNADKISGSGCATWMNAWASSQVGNRRRRGPRPRSVRRRRGPIAPAGRIETAVPNSGQGVNPTAMW